MRTMEQIREGLERTWDRLAEGWHELSSRASEAVTRFQLPIKRDEVESREDRIALSSPRWGFLPVEVREGDDTVEVSLEIPGMDSDDFDIQVDGDLLRVRGEKRVSREETRGDFHVMQRAYGRFERAVQLPAHVDEASGKATYRKGVLHIALTKSAGSRKRRIEVKSG